jgi:hypothetical protein
MWTAMTPRGRPAAREGRLGAVMAHAPIALFALDRAGMITLSEGQGLTALRRSWPQETVGRSVFDVYRDVPEIVAYARRALAGEECAVVVMVGGVVCACAGSCRRRSGSSPPKSWTICS